MSWNHLKIQGKTMSIKLFAPKSVEMLSIIRNASRLKNKEVLNAIKSKMNPDYFDKNAFTYYISDDGDAYPVVFHDNISSYGDNWEYLIPVYHFCRTYIPKTTKSEYSIFALSEYNCILVFFKDILIEYESEVDGKIMELKIKEEQSSIFAKGCEQINIFSDKKLDNFDSTVIAYTIPEGIKKFNSFEIAKKHNFLYKYFKNFSFNTKIDLQSIMELLTKNIPVIVSVFLLFLVAYQQYQLSNFNENVEVKLKSITDKAKQETEAIINKTQEPLNEMKKISDDIKDKLSILESFHSENIEKIKQLDKRVEQLLRVGFSDKDKEKLDSIFVNFESVKNNVDSIAKNGVSTNANGLSEELEKKLKALTSDLANISNNSVQEKFKLAFKSGNNAVIMINDDKFRFIKNEKIDIGNKKYSFDFDKEVIIVEENGKSKTFPVSK
jgi:hypothetical protein